MPGVRPVLITDQSAAAAMVAAAVASLEESARKDRLADFRRRPDEIPDRELPEVRAIRDAPARLRRECIVRAARPGFRDRRLLPLISGKLAGLTAADIESFLPPPDASPDLHGYCRPDYTLCRQIEHSFTTLLDDAERARLRPGLERVAGVFSPPGSPVAIRLRKLIAADGRIPYPYIEDSDAGPRLRAVFADSPEPAVARAALLNLLAVFPDSGDPGQDWRAEARRVRGMLASPDIFAGRPSTPCWTPAPPRTRGPRGRSTATRPSCAAPRCSRA